MKNLGKVLQNEWLMISIQETVRIGTPRQGMNELCIKSWLPLANVGSSALHQPRGLYLKWVKLLLSVLKHEFLEVLVILRHGRHCGGIAALSSWQSTGSCSFWATHLSLALLLKLPWFCRQWYLQKTFTSIKITVKLLCISIKHGVSAGLCSPHCFVLDTLILCLRKG